MKQTIKFSSILGMFLVLLLACNQTPQQNAETETMDEGMFGQDQNMRVDQLKEDLRDINERIDSIANQEGTEFRNEADELLSEVNQTIDQFQSDLQQTGEAIDMSTQQAIDNLKREASELQGRLEQATGEAEDNWEEIQEEVKRDFTTFGNSVEDFFTDNV